MQAEEGKLPKIERENLTPEDASLFKEISLGVIRNKFFLDHTIDEFVKKKTTKSLRNILRMGVYQLLFLDKIPHYAILFETVNLAKNHHEKRFINAILRKISSQPKELFFKRKLETLEDISIYYSFPLWLLEKWNHLLGFEETKKTCELSNKVTSLALRINTLKKEAFDTEKKMKNLFPHASRGIVSKNSYIIPQNTSFSGFGEFKEGHFVIQNEASQLAALALDPKPHETILDACASPGIKASHIAALMKNQGEISCIDKKNPRLFHENMERLGITIATYHNHDLLTPIQSHKTYDRILLDAPCSCWGILRKYPEIKWQQTQKDVTQLQDIQKRIRDNLLLHLKDGGVFVYSVCTFSKEETLDFIDDTLKKYSNLKLESLNQILPESVRKFIHKEGYFLCTPQRDGLDGFFICRFASRVLKKLKNTY